MSQKSMPSVSNLFRSRRIIPNFAFVVSGWRRPGKKRASLPLRHGAAGEHVAIIDGWERWAAVAAFSALIDSLLAPSDFSVFPDK